MLDADTIANCGYAAMAIFGGGALVETVRLLYKRHKPNKVVSALRKKITTKTLTVEEAVDAAWKDESVQWYFNYEEADLHNYLSSEKVQAWFKTASDASD